MGRSRNARVGFYATVVIVIVGYLISMATSRKQQKNWGTPYHIIFNRVEGIEEGTKVFYNGRLVGRVRKLEVQMVEDEQTGVQLPVRADITISISPLYTASVELTQNSQYKVEGGTLWGEKWIAIQWEPGEIVPAGGAVKGESISSLYHRMQHGVQNLDWMHEIVEGYRNQLGSGDKAREKVKSLIRYWNYLAFDLRVQANKFNQFSGLINERMDKAFDAVAARIVSIRSRGAMMGSQIQLYTRALQNAATQQSARTAAIVDRLKVQLTSVQASVGGLDAFVMSGDKLMENLLEMARRRVREAEDMVAALRFVSKNPALASQIRTLAANMRKQSGDLRAFIDNLRKQVAPNPQPSSDAPKPSLPRGTEGAPSRGPEQPPAVPGIMQPPMPSALPTSAVPLASPAPRGAPNEPAPAPLPTGH